MRLLPVVALASLVAACTPAPKAEAPAAPAAPAALSAAEIDAVKAVDAAWAAAMNAKDTTAVFAIYSDDAKLMPPDAPILEGAALRSTLTGLLASGATDFVLTPQANYGIGDLAYSVGTATFKAGKTTASIKYAEVLRKGADGKWHYVVDMFSGLAAPAKK